MNTNNPKYAFTWVDDDKEDDRDIRFAVWDSCEGFQPAWALVWACDADSAGEVAEVISSGRLKYSSETLVVVEYDDSMQEWMKDSIKEGMMEFYVIKRENGETLYLSDYEKSHGRAMWSWTREYGTFADKFPTPADAWIAIQVVEKWWHEFIGSRAVFEIVDTEMLAHVPYNGPSVQELEPDTGTSEINSPVGRPQVEELPRIHNGAYEFSQDHEILRLRGGCPTCNSMEENYGDAQEEGKPEPQYFMAKIRVDDMKGMTVPEAIGILINTKIGSLSMKVTEIGVSQHV